MCSLSVPIGFILCDFEKPTHERTNVPGFRSKLAFILITCHLRSCPVQPNKPLAGVELIALCADICAYVTARARRKHSVLLTARDDCDNHDFGESSLEPEAKKGKNSLMKDPAREPSNELIFPEQPQIPRRARPSLPPTSFHIGRTLLTTRGPWHKQTNAGPPTPSKETAHQPDQACSLGRAGAE